MTPCTTATSQIIRKQFVGMATPLSQFDVVPSAISASVREKQQEKSHEFTYDEGLDHNSLVICLQ